MSDRVEVSDRGAFEIDGVPPGLTDVVLTIEVGSEILARRVIGPTGPPGTRLRVDWQLEPVDPGRVRGRLLLNGEPHSGTVNWIKSGKEGHRTVGRDGEFAFDAVPLGELELTAFVSSSSVEPGRNGWVTGRVLVEEGRVAPVDLDLALPIAPIRGTLTGLDGQPLGGVEIWCSNAEDRSSYSCVSDDAGRWSLPVAASATPYRIRSRRPLREEGLEVHAGAEDIALHELATGRVRIRALDAVSGEVMRSIRLSMRAANGEMQSLEVGGRAALDASGWATVDVPEGERQVGAWTPDRSHVGSARSVLVQAGREIEVELRLERAEALTLRLAADADPLPERHVVLLLTDAEYDLVTAEPGPGMPQVSFESLSFEPGRYRQAHLRPANTHTVRAIAPGRYRFKVFPDDVAIEPEWVDVPHEGVVDVRWSSKP